MLIKKNLNTWMKNMVTLDQSCTNGSRYLADLELLSLINDCFVWVLIGMLLSKYMASQGLGSLVSCFSKSNSSLDIVKISNSPVLLVAFDITQQLFQLFLQFSSLNPCSFLDDLMLFLNYGNDFQESMSVTPIPQITKENLLLIYDR